MSNPIVHVPQKTEAQLGNNKTTGNTKTQDVIFGTSINDRKVNPGSSRTDMLRQTNKIGKPKAAQQRSAGAKSLELTVRGNTFKNFDDKSATQKTKGNTAKSGTNWACSPVGSSSTRKNNSTHRVSSASSSTSGSSNKSVEAIRRQTFPGFVNFPKDDKTAQRSKSMSRTNHSLQKDNNDTKQGSSNSEGKKKSFLKKLFEKKKITDDSSKQENKTQDNAETLFTATDTYIENETVTADGGKNENNKIKENVDEFYDDIVSMVRPDGRISIRDVKGNVENITVHQVSCVASGGFFLRDETGARPKEQTVSQIDELFFGNDKDTRPKHQTTMTNDSLPYGDDTGARPKEQTTTKRESPNPKGKELLLPNDIAEKSVKNKKFPSQSAYIEIRATKDSIVDLEVDVIVSSEDSSLHSGGLVASTIAIKGGHLLVVCKDCVRKICPNLSQWTFQPTPASGKLKCKHVFHAVVPHFSKHNQTKWVDGLGSLLQSILHRTDRMGYETLALPLLGTGKNGAPVDFVVDMILQTINQFGVNGSTIGCLQSVTIAHPDKKIKQSIDERIKNLGIVSQKIRSRISSKNNSKPNHKSHFLTVNDRKTDTCPICMEEVTCSKLRQLSKCKHIFCKNCLEECFSKRAPTCPICNMVYGEMTGNQPDGIMVETFHRDTHLPGYPHCGTIQVFYSFLDGTQNKEHPTPGAMYKGTKRMAYLPDNKEGQKVHRLLRRAFDQRLLFTIGSSRTTGKEDVVTWNDVHHKTNKSGGPSKYGYPDPEYLSRVLDELAAKGITEDEDFTEEP